MPKLETNATVTTTREIRLQPQLRKKLLTELRAYAALRDQAKAIEHAMKKHSASIADLRAETGEESIELDGFKITLVAPVRKQFDAKKFVALGGNLDIYNGAMKEVLSKAYNKITLPGADAEEGAE